ncbi:MAG: glutaredoxin domain-containing protein, partial [Candidatus Micrarchaeota archaeon]
WCVKTKEFLQENGIDFVDKDVSNPENARQALSVSGQSGIPVTVIDGTPVIGFDVERLRQLLRLN